MNQSQMRVESRIIFKSASCFLHPPANSDFIFSKCIVLQVLLNIFTNNDFYLEAKQLHQSPLHLRSELYFVTSVIFGRDYSLLLLSIYHIVDLVWINWANNSIEVLSFRKLTLEIINHKFWNIRIILQNWIYTL